MKLLFSGQIGSEQREYYEQRDDSAKLAIAAMEFFNNRAALKGQSGNVKVMLESDGIISFTLVDSERNIILRYMFDQTTNQLRDAESGARYQINLIGKFGYKVEGIEG